MRLIYLSPRTKRAKKICDLFNKFDSDIISLRLCKSMFFQDFAIYNFNNKKLKNILKIGKINNTFKVSYDMATKKSFINLFDLYIKRVNMTKRYPYMYILKENNIYYLFYVGMTYTYYFTINIRLKERTIKEDYFIYEVEPNKNVIIGGI